MVWPRRKKKEPTAEAGKEGPKKKSYHVPNEMIVSVMTKGIDGDQGIYGIGRPTSSKGIEEHLTLLKKINLSAITVHDPKEGTDAVGLYEPTGILYRFVGFINMEDSTVTLSGKVVKKLKVDAQGIVTDENGRVVE